MKDDHEIGVFCCHCSDDVEFYTSAVFPNPVKSVRLLHSGGTGVGESFESEAPADPVPPR